MLLQSAPVEHPDVPAAVADQALPLQLQRGGSHAFATHAQHACDAFLRDPHFIAHLSVQVLEQPATQLRGQGVGALVTAVLFSIGRYGIAAYLTYTATASTYGAAGSVVLILLWVYYSSLILLFGAAFTRTQLLAHGRSVVPRNSAVRVRHEVVTDA